MRILLAHNSPYYPSCGGGDRSNRILMEGLAARGHAVRVVARVAQFGAQAERTLLQQLARRRVRAEETDGAAIRIELKKAAAASPLTNVAAEPAAPAREYAVLEGPPLAAEGDAARAGASQVMQPPAGVAPASPVGVAGQDEPILDVVEKQLAAFLGPVAKVVVRKAALRARDTEELYALLAENLEREEERKTFLAGRVESRTQFKSASPAEPAAPSAATAPATPAPRTELAREVIDRAAAMLARYVGPIAGVLAKRTAPRADSARALHLLLAQHIETEADRAGFLRDAGVSERK